MDVHGREQDRQEVVVEGKVGVEQLVVAKTVVVPGDDLQWSETSNVK